ncbi:Outer membrane protein assembly factor BamE [Candidatus Providencia siddallii]|uniref:Outer membrane protein assembly factor BamE n=1 Tax=Candidatus Providencia siddallii TaxID=1715285 RepID=A0A0M6W8R7_9GAMM|nr:Outer membrane protein assembly factor BamE [Candidatus Providencia siddallii]
MRYKLLIISLIILLTLNGCIFAEYFIYHQNINQGNYLVKKDIDLIVKGMTKEEVVYILGTPILSYPFGTQTWFYVFRQKIGYNTIKQKTLILLFNDNGILIDIKFKNIFHNK